ncbi:hypothetical protein [uncultured Amnibacterium sp.]|uniref:hypothetical protein n=1 Tax=uncultured Amnibacterium sp. TaxID=1631851 RepID=UPI0035C9AC50
MTATRTPSRTVTDGRATAGTTAPYLAIAAGLVGAVLALVQLVLPPIVTSDWFSLPFTPTVATIVAVVLALQHAAIVPLMALLPRIAAPSTLGRIGGAVTSVGLVGLAVAELVSITAMNEQGDTAIVDAVNTGYAVPTILLGIGELLLGIAVIRAGRWRGWPRAVVLLAGIFVFVPLIPALAVSGPFWAIALALWSLLYLAIGVGALREGRGAAR